MTKPPTRSRSAFSIVETLILIAAALVIAGLTVPVLRGMTLANNAESALRTLVAIRDFEVRFKEMGLAAGPAGAARFGTVGELVRAGLNLEDAELFDSDRLLRRHGYLFRVSFATGNHELVVDPSSPGVVDSKNAFVVYAWPEDYGSSGSSVFALDAGANLRVPAPAGILESKNLLHSYSGGRGAPPGTAARMLLLQETTPPKAGSIPATKPALNPSIALLKGEDGEAWEVIPYPTPQ